MANPYASDDVSYSSERPPRTSPPNDPPPPPDGDPPPSDGPIVPHEPPPPDGDGGPPDIDVALPDIVIPDIGIPNIGLPDIGGPGIDIGLPGGPGGIDVGVNADGNGLGGILAGDSDGLNLLSLNGDDDTDAVINVGAPVASGGSAEIGGDGSHINFGSDGSLLDLGGDGGNLGLIAVNSDSDALISVGVQDGGAADMGSLINAAMLDIGGTGISGVLPIGDAYDGNVPLVGDLSSALELTLDHLTTATSLFDVPVLDVLSLDGLDS
jgi:hypothetical protein